MEGGPGVLLATVAMGLWRTGGGKAGRNRRRLPPPTHGKSASFASRAEGGCCVWRRNHDYHAEPTHAILSKSADASTAPRCRTFRHSARMRLFGAGTVRYVLDKYGRTRRSERARGALAQSKRPISRAEASLLKARQGRRSPRAAVQEEAGRSRTSTMRLPPAQDGRGGRRRPQGDG